MCFIIVHWDCSSEHNALMLWEDVVDHSYFHKVYKDKVWRKKMWHYSLNPFSRYHHTGVFRMLYNEHSKEYLGMNVTWNFSPPMQKASDEVYDSPFPWVTFTYVHLQLQLITEKGPACFASQTGEGSSSCCNPGWSIHGVALPRNPSLAVTRRGWLCLPPPPRSCLVYKHGFPSTAHLPQSHRIMFQRTAWADRNAPSGRLSNLSGGKHTLL